MWQPPRRTSPVSNGSKATRVVKAPFEGVITVRNVDVGALVNSGNTLLFRIAQTGTLRTYVNVPQAICERGSRRATGAAHRRESSRP